MIHVFIEQEENIYTPRGIVSSVLLYYIGILGLTTENAIDNNLCTQEFAFSGKLCIAKTYGHYIFNLYQCW